MTISDIANILMCLLTALLVIVSYVQLNAIKKTQNSQFLQNILNDVFTDEAVELITFLHTDTLSFKENQANPIFSIDKEKIQKMFPQKDWTSRTFYTSYEMDCLLLNHLDGIGGLESRDMITLESVHQYYGWYIKAVVNNEAIKQYFIWLRDVDNCAYVFDKLQAVNDKFLLKEF